MITDPGTLPATATFAELLDARARAASAVFASLETWHRFCRKYDMLGTLLLDRAPERLRGRYNAATEAFTRRCWLVVTLAEQEPQGRA